MVVRNAVGERTAVCFGFNGWGKKYKGWQKDVGVNVAIAQALKLPVVQSDLVLEGGAVEIGTLKGELVGIATEQCVRSDLPRALQTHFAAPSEFNQSTSNRFVPLSTSSDRHRFSTEIERLGQRHK